MTTKPGYHEYHTANEFMAAAHALILQVYGQKGDAPRSLINLTFLALEVVLKSHTKSLGINYRREHEISNLYEPIEKHPNGIKLIGEVRDEYEHILKSIGAKLPACNGSYETMDKVVALLTKNEFMRWRYIFEALENEVLSGKTSHLEFPFFNVYLLTWLFMARAAKTFADEKFPQVLMYDRMPYWLRVEKEPTSPSAVRWSAEIRILALGRGAG